MLRLHPAAPWTRRRAAPLDPRRHPARLIEIALVAERLPEADRELADRGVAAALADVVPVAAPAPLGRARSEHRLARSAQPCSPFGIAGLALELAPEAGRARR